MAKQTVGLGSSANDGTGDPLRTAFDKINDNFDELYLTSTVTAGNNITITANTIASDNSNGDINIDPDGTGRLILATGSELRFTDHVDNAVPFLDADGDTKFSANLTYNGSSALAVTGSVTATTTMQGTTITATTAFVPDASDGAALGTTALQFSDLFLADAAVIGLGDDQDVTITHVADSGITIKSAATADDKPITITLQTGETDMAANDKIGVINFQAPDEGAGTDAILVAAGIEAVSEGDFSASANATKLSFKTAASAAAAETMALSSVGLLTLNGSGSSIIIKDGGNIGSASDTNAIGISSGGVVSITATTASTSATSGALTVAGGAGIAADLSVGDDVRLISDAAVLSFGANSDVTLTHVADAGLTLSVPATADNSFPTFNLSAGDNDIAVNDVLGQINFQAPAEGAGTDAILVAAGIAAISEGDFSASNNATKLSFQTGASEAAAEKMSLSSAGALDVTGDITGATLNADGDTSAGDNAAIGYTSALGIIVTGQGSTNDITLVNDADATVLAVPTGTVNVTTAGRLQPTTFSSGVVTLVATGAITAALHAGKTLNMAEVGGNAAATFTLPAATGTGDKYRFYVGVVNTSNYLIKVANANDTIDGQVIVQNDTTEGGTASVIGWKATGTDDTITLNGTTTGGASIGDYVELTDLIANQYVVSGMLQASGTEASPFSATVS